MLSYSLASVSLVLFNNEQRKLAYPNILHLLIVQKAMYLKYLCYYINLVNLGI